MNVSASGSASHARYGPGRAHVSATGYARAHASQAIDVELDASSAGHYQVGLPARGWCDFSVVASRGTDRLERRISVEAR